MSPNTMSLEVKGLIAGLSAALVTLLVVFGVSALVRQQIAPAAANKAIPVTRGAGPNPGVQARLAAGRKVFADNCASCHGDHAAGGMGPDLRHTDLTTTELAATIKKGVKGKMPAFANQLTATQQQEVIVYIESLKSSTAKPVPAKPVPASPKAVT